MPCLGVMLGMQDAGDRLWSGGGKVMAKQNKTKKSSEATAKHNKEQKEHAAKQ